jgi:carbonic anhydrase/acetyltransferase-like protein (isoleucine patch superfamily)
VTRLGKELPIFETGKVIQNSRLENARSPDWMCFECESFECDCKEKEMLIRHAGKQPQIDPSAWVAPDATVCGDVVIGPGCRIMHGARIVGEDGGLIRLGRACIVMENAVVRATRRHACTIGDHCLIGPCAHVVGALLQDQVFIATGASIFHGAVLGRGSEVRVHGTVHLRTRLEAGATVPIGWIAVGDPASVLPPGEHDKIWSIQAPLNFPEWVYGFDRNTPNLMIQVTDRLSHSLESHMNDEELGPESTQR